MEFVDGGFGRRQKRPDTALTASKVPAQPIGGRVQQPLVGRELLQRPHAAGCADDGHQITWLDLRVDVWIALRT